MTPWVDGTGEGSAAAADDEASTVDDADEYEEAEGGNGLFGFMFGNVDNSGDLDVDYLDEKFYGAPMVLHYGAPLHTYHQSNGDGGSYNHR
ncbi:hypothetical protein OROGR_031393 [Orobanche gracilis]